MACCASYQYLEERPYQSERAVYKQVMKDIANGTTITPELLCGIGFKPREGEFGEGYFDLRLNGDWFQIFKGRTIVSNDDDAWNLASMSYIFNFEFYYIEQLESFLKLNPEVQ